MMPENLDAGIKVRWDSSVLFKTATDVDASCLLDSYDEQGYSWAIYARLNEANEFGTFGSMNTLKA